MAEAGLKHMKFLEAQGELVRKTDIAKEWGARALEYSNALDYLETRLPPLIEGKNQGDMRMIIRKEVRRIKENVLRTGQFCPAI